MARSGDLGCAGSGIRASGRVWRRPKKVYLRRKWVKTEENENFDFPTFMISVWNLQFQTALLRNWLLCGGTEEQIDLTILTRQGGVDNNGPGSPGRA